MPSLRNAMVKTVCDAIEDGQLDFHVAEVLANTYPGTPIGPGFLSDASEKWRSVMKAVEGLEEVSLIPLTEIYFAEYRSELPDIEKEARRCVAGAIPRCGPAVGCRVAKQDILTTMWRKYADEAAVGHVRTAMAKNSALCDSLGLQSPKSKLASEVLKIAR